MRHPVVTVEVSNLTKDDRLFAAAAAGASSFVGKDAPSEEVVAAARHAQASPQTFLSGENAGVLKRRSAGTTRRKLSNREREIAALLIDGLPIGQVARRLSISGSTVKTHLENVASAGRRHPRIALIEVPRSPGQ